MDSIRGANPVRNMGPDFPFTSSGSSSPSSLSLFPPNRPTSIPPPSPLPSANFHSAAPYHPFLRLRAGGKESILKISICLDKISIDKRRLNSWHRCVTFRVAVGTLLPPFSSPCSNFHVIFSIISWIFPLPFFLWVFNSQLFQKKKHQESPRNKSAIPRDSLRILGTCRDAGMTHLIFGFDPCYDPNN